jgi:uncharacterized membrane protein
MLLGKPGKAPGIVLGIAGLIPGVAGTFVA